jgi:hypothetical protein
MIVPAHLVPDRSSTRADAPDEGPVANEAFKEAAVNGSFPCMSPVLELCDQPLNLKLNKSSY